MIMQKLIETLNPEVNLDGKTILVTGSSGGIGRAVALACADAGATVILSGRNLSALNEIYDLILSKGNPEPAIVELDLAKASEVEFKNLCCVVKSTIGSLHGIVHCATHITELGPTHRLGLDSWEQLFRVNVIAPALMIKNCESLFSKAGCGSVVLTSDNHAFPQRIFTWFWTRRIDFIDKIRGFQCSHPKLTHLITIQIKTLFNSRMCR